jgi:hypothetical protein
MTVNENKFNDYWLQNKKFICFPNTPGTMRRFGDIIVSTIVLNEKQCPTQYSFYYCYAGDDSILKEIYDNLYVKARDFFKNVSNHNRIRQINGLNMVYWRSTDSNKPTYNFYDDFLSSIKSSFISEKKHFNCFKQLMTNKSFSDSCEEITKEAAFYKKNRGILFEEKFGKNINDFVSEEELQKEQQKKIVYSILVGEAYSRLERLRDECNIIMEGLQNGRKGYKLETYKAFIKELDKVNNHIGLDNPYIKEGRKQRTIQYQTLKMFLREHANKPGKKVKQ